MESNAYKSAGGGAALKSFLQAHWLRLRNASTVAALFCTAPRRPHPWQYPHSSPAARAVSSVSILRVWMFELAGLRPAPARAPPPPDELAPAREGLQQGTCGR